MDVSHESSLLILDVTEFADASVARLQGGRGWSVLAKPRSFTFRGFPAVQPRPPDMGYEKSFLSIADEHDLPYRKRVAVQPGF